MANIGATTAFYKVETSLTRANNEVSKSMERLATGKANANAWDRSSYVAMADTFRLDFVGTKAGIKGASVVMGYLETGMRGIRLCLCASFQIARACCFRCQWNKHCGRW